MAKYYSTKTYTHAEGLSCAFRQWGAESHCRLLHGYAFEIKFEFGSTALDSCNWVVDFGSLKDLKVWLKHMFDHTTCVADNDPYLETFKDLNDKQLIDLRVVQKVGCEGFAEMIYNYSSKVIADTSNNRCWVQSVEVREHSGNSAKICNDTH